MLPLPSSAAPARSLGGGQGACLLPRPPHPMTSHEPVLWDRRGGLPAAHTGDLGLAAALTEPFPAVVV